MSSSSTPEKGSGSGSPVPLDKSPDNWFTKFSRATETPQDCLRGYSDRFNGITVDSSFEGQVEDFPKKLESKFPD